MAQRFRLTILLLSLAALVCYAFDVHDYFRIYDPVTGNLIFSVTDSGVQADVVSATDTISSPTFTFSDSGVSMLVGEATSGMDGYVQKFDYANNSIILQPEAGGISEGEVNTLIQSATESLTPAEIGAATATDYLPLSGGTMEANSTINMASSAISDATYIETQAIRWIISSSTEGMVEGEMRMVDLTP